MKKLNRFAFAFAAALAVFAVGCATTTTEIVDPGNDTGDYVAGLDARDFENAAGDLVASMLSSGALEKPAGGRYVMAIGRVKNDTSLHVQPSLITKKIRTDLLRSGKVVVTAAMGAAGAEEGLVRESRDLAADAIFDQSTVQQNGQVVAAELSLSGAIVQQKNKIDRKRERIDYYFQMQVTDLKTGLVFWEDEIRISKKAAR